MNIDKENIIQFIKKLYNNTFNFNELYNENINLIVSLNIKELKLISNLHYLLNLSNIENTIISDKLFLVKSYFISDTLVWYNENKIKRKYFMEEFWSSSLQIFMNEYNEFEKTKQSYLFFWTNLINLSTLFVRIDSSSSYTISSTNLLPELPEINERGYYVKSNEYDGNSLARYIEIHKKEWINYKDNLIKLLINSLDCNYDNVYKLYQEYIKFIYINDIETHKYTFIEKNNTLYSIMTLNNTLPNYYNTFFIYLSLIKPYPEKFARTLCTKFATTIINPTIQIDNIFMTTTEMICHDFYAHGMLLLKKEFSDEIKQFVYNIFNLLIETNNEKMLSILIYYFHQEVAAENITPLSLEKYINLYYNIKNYNATYVPNFKIINDNFRQFLIDKNIIILNNDNTVSFNPNNVIIGYFESTLKNREGKDIYAL